MASKQFEIEGLGVIHVYKRRGAKNIRLSVNSDGQIRATMPTWLPYQAALAFAQQKRQWLANQSQRDLLAHNQRIGKYHTLKLVAKPGITKPQTRLTDTEALVYCPVGASQVMVQTAAHTVAKRAAKVEAERLLPQRLRDLAQKHRFEFNKVAVRHLKSRWGSCSSQANITLNYYLMQLPWELIDYVLIHELVHTQELNHSPAFWQKVEACLPDYKQRRKNLKSYQPSLLTAKA